jgi:ABC-2 type transport system permease protein
MGLRLFSKFVADLRGQVIGWGVGMAIMLAITVAMFPSISDIYGDVVNQLPDAMAAFVGDEGSFKQIEGYLNAEFFNYAPVILAVFAILAGGAMIANEESQGTMDLLLAQPLSRFQLATTKLVAFVLSTTLLISIMSLGFWITIGFIDTPFSPSRMTISFLLFLPFEVFVGLTASFFAQLFGSRMTGGTILAVLLVASYILEALGKINDILDRFNPVYLTVYFQGGEALVSEISWLRIAVLMGGIVIIASANTVLFMRRDIASNGVIHLPSLRRFKTRKV